ncbi:MAG: 6-phosphogluconolactonase [Bacteroidota bacterium]
MSAEIKVFPTPTDVARAFAQMIQEQSHAHDRFNIALSGGSTPKLLFDIMAKDFSSTTNWSSLHFYWGDERCVPPDDPESNYLMTKEHLLDPLNLPESNIHRVLGESNPSEEAERYGSLIEEHLPVVNELPQFDLIILGMGTDGHTASIFPHQMELLNSEKTCAIATHPDSGQKRVTLTGPVINNAKSVAFLVTGASKKEKFEAIQANIEIAQDYPAAHIQPTTGKLTWWIDEAVTK